MIKLAANPSEQNSPALAAKTGRWRTVIVGCLLPLHTGILLASPAFSQQHPMFTRIQDSPRAASWTQEERQQIMRFYEPIGLNNSSHWHDWDCCQTYRCFPARPGSVKWTPNGIAITHPDGDVLLYSEHDPMWKPKTGAGLFDPRDHICWEKNADGEWFPLCGYRAEVMG